FEFALREETNVAAVGRPEGEQRVFGGRHWLGLECVERSQPELLLAVKRRRDGEQSPVGGNGEAPQRGVFRRGDGVAEGARALRLLAEMKKGEAERNEDRNSPTRPVAEGTALCLWRLHWRRRLIFKILQNNPRLADRLQPLPRVLL